MKRRIFIIAIVTIAVTLSTVGIIVYCKQKQEAFQMEQIELYRGRLKETEIAEAFGLQI